MAKALCRVLVDMEGCSVDMEGWWVERDTRAQAMLSEPRRLVFRALDMMVLMLLALNLRGCPDLRSTSC